MKNITPHLWFNNNVKEAVQFYTGIFPNSKVLSEATLHNTPSGDTDIVNFKLGSQPFMAINGGDTFKFNPAISFIVNFDPSKVPNAEVKLEKLWQNLLTGGKELMPLDKYFFSKKYGWVEDKFGLSWQLILSDPEGEERPLITPALLFTGPVAGKAEETINFYLSVFKNSSMGAINRYPPGMEPDKEGTIMYADFMLENTWFAAMDSAREHGYNFTEAVSFMVYCKTQEKIDYYWEKLSAEPKFEQCGWLKDKFGVSWQIVPTAMGEMMEKGTQRQIDKLTQTFLPMKKLIIADLEKAYNSPDVS